MSTSRFLRALAPLTVTAVALSLAPAAASAAVAQPRPVAPSESLSPHPPRQPAAIASGVLYVDRMPSTTPKQRKNVLTVTTAPGCYRGAAVARVSVRGTIATVSVKVATRASCAKPSTRQASVSLSPAAASFVDASTGRPFEVVESITY